jgi:amyloid beta precursor protein binding protein 1
MLEHAHICVLNCGLIGLEALKNLVLGGISSFTIVYASKVCGSDLGNNYFGMLFFFLYVSSLA